MIENQAPAALLIKADSFAKTASGGRPAEASLRREEALAGFLELFSPQDLLVATTGKTGRELYELRVRRNEPLDDFLTVGSMGHASSIALGAALARPDRRVICLDGDGAALMHLGALAMIGAQGPANYIHLLLNNRCHESVGCQPTCNLEVSFVDLAKACGYQSGHKVENLAEIKSIWPIIDHSPGPHFLEVAISPGARKNLGRPKNSPKQCRDHFMKKF